MFPIVFRKFTLASTIITIVVNNRTNNNSFPRRKIPNYLKTYYYHKINHITATTTISSDDNHIIMMNKESRRKSKKNNYYIVSESESSASSENNNGNGRQSGSTSNLPAVQKPIDYRQNRIEGHEESISNRNSLMLLQQQQQNYYSQFNLLPINQTTYNNNEYYYNPQQLVYYPYYNNSNNYCAVTSSSFVGNLLFDNHNQMQSNLSYQYFHSPETTLSSSSSQSYDNRPVSWSQSQQRRQSLTMVKNNGNHQKRKNKFRFWEIVKSINDDASSANDDKLIFSIMSYNVLAQDLMARHRNLYAHHNTEHLNWNRRFQNIYNEIDSLAPDILCLQEVQTSHISTNFVHFDRLGYTGIFKPRTGTTPPDGCAIYFKHNLLVLVEHHTVEFNQMTSNLLNRDNVAIIAKFASKRDPHKQFVVATTHLLYNPRREDVRVAQMQLLLTEIERLAFQHHTDTNVNSYLPVILTGDFNAAPTSSLYEFITSGKLNYEHLAPPFNSQTAFKRGKILVPSSLGITDQCQHADIVTKRLSKEVVSRSEEMALIKLKHSDYSSHDKDEISRLKADFDANHQFSSGTLSHQFPLKSVYSHFVDGSNDDVEATTYQDEWVSVDYIFYSATNRDNADKLTLLAKYRLPTKNELGDTRIPNEKLGSDHLCLVAKFQLND